MTPAWFRPGTPLRRGATTLAAVAIAGYAGLVGLLVAREPALVYQAERSRRPPPALDARLVPTTLRTADGETLDVLLARGDSAGLPWLLFFHGNGASVRGRSVQGQLLALRDAGFSVLAIDYRGFGRSTGTPSEAGLAEDARAAWSLLTDSLRVPPAAIVLMGHSLGSGVATQLAGQVAARALVLAGAFTSVPDVGQARYPWAPVTLLARERFDNAARIGAVGEPVLVVHGRRDRIVPFEQGLELFLRAAGPKLMLPVEGGHLDAPFADAARFRAVLRRLLGTAPPAEEAREPAPPPSVSR